MAIRGRLGHHRLSEFLRETQDADYLAAKAADIGNFCRLALLLTAVFLVTTIVFDYAIDPINAGRAIWLRIVESLAVVGWALASWKDIHSRAARIAALVTPLFVEITFLYILSILDNGAAYGMGGILFGYIFGPFLVLAQPFGFAVLVLSLPAVFAAVAAFLGLPFGINWAVFTTYAWMGFVPVVFILLFFEYLYWNVFSYRRQIEKQAVTDTLTQIANRRHFIGEGTRSLTHHHEYRHPACLLFIDVDHFKTINDRHGHHAGDAAIKHVVDTLDPLVRDSDLIARYGGEEFVVLLRETTAGTAAGIAERMRAAVAAHPFPLDGKNTTIIDLTVSIGIAAFEAGDKPDIDLLIRNADHALYQAKHRGRDRVVAYE